MIKHKGTPHQAFSIIQNCRTYRKGKNVELDKMVSKRWYESSPTPFKKYCKKVWNDIENSLYEYDDLKIFFLYNYILDPKSSSQNVDDKKINTVRKALSATRYKNDKTLLLDMNKKIKLKSVEDYFTIRKGGTSYIYDLIEKRYISPITFLNLRPKLNLKESQYGESEKYKAFIRFIDELKRQMKNDK